MTKPFQVGYFRFATLLIAVLLAVGSFAIDSAVAQEADLPSDGQRFVTVGQLAAVKMKGTKSTRYVLLDEMGEVTSTLRESAGVELKEYVGQDVGITARTLIDGETPILLAESVTTFGVARQITRDDVGKHVAMASYEEEQDDLLMASNAVPSSIVSGPIVSSGPIVDHGYPVTYGDPIVEESYVGASCGVAGCDSCGSGCGQAGCSSCAACPCGLPGRFWIRSEYLIWWTEGMNTPALVTTSPNGVSRSNAGVLGVPGTETLFGGEPLFSDSRSGARFRIGKWCDQCNWIGFETEYFFLSDEDQNFSGCDVGPTVYARPFFNSNLNREDSELVQLPGVVNGSIHVETDTSLWSISPRLRVNLACERLGCNPCNPCCDPCNPCSVGGYRMDMLVGYRYMQLEDTLRIRESLATVDPTNPTYFNLRDSFDSSNEFHGADIGLLWEGYKGPWSLELVGRVAFGNTSQEVTIAGSTTTTSNGTSITDPGALLALDSNIGTYTRDEFTVLSEASATLGYALSPRSRFLVGYTFIYWPGVVRAGDHIDLNVNTDLIPPAQTTTGEDVPAFAFSDTGFWAQGLSLGMEYRW